MKFMDFDTLAEHGPVNREKYAAPPSAVINEFENRFQDCQEDNQFFCLVAIPFSVDVNQLNLDQLNQIHRC